jgi:hypothetical protein
MPWYCLEFTSLRLFVVYTRMVPCTSLEPLPVFDIISDTICDGFCFPDLHKLCGALAVYFICPIPKLFQTTLIFSSITIKPITAWWIWNKRNGNYRISTSVHFEFSYVMYSRKSIRKTNLSILWEFITIFNLTDKIFKLKRKIEQRVYISYNRLSYPQVSQVYVGLLEHLPYICIVIYFKSKPHRIYF